MRVEQEMGQTWQSLAVALNHKGGSCLALPGDDTPPSTATPGTGHPPERQRVATTGREVGQGRQGLGMLQGARGILHVLLAMHYGGPLAVETLL